MNMDTSANNQARARPGGKERTGQYAVTQAQSRPVAVLPPPGGLVAEPGAGQVTLRWQPVAGAVGYLVHRSESPAGPFKPVDHGGGDVLAVPGSPYCDATGIPGTRYWYAVASIADASSDPGKLSRPIEA